MKYLLVLLSLCVLVIGCAPGTTVVTPDSEAGVVPAPAQPSFDDSDQDDTSDDSHDDSDDDAHDDEVEEDSSDDVDDDSSSDEEDESNDDSQEVSGGETHTIEMGSFGFEPDRIEIALGDTVRFLNTDSKVKWPASDVHPTHTVFPGSNINKCGTDEADDIFDACRGIADGESYSFTFDEAGTWNYHDHLRPSHTGQIVVR